ncbi:hypothetical protein NHP21005_14990 [Helicobacter sp. NHP21005]|nr:hypothetical protein NHP21005_14990 [Helicobacter sp. NHP21005]
MKRLKAEWEEQTAVLMAYPHAATDWGAYLDEAQACFINIINALSYYQEMIVCVHPNDTESQDRLATMSQVQIALCDSNDTWARDFGPLCVETNGIALYLDFIFNAWGQIPSPLRQCDQLQARPKGIVKAPPAFCQLRVRRGECRERWSGDDLNHHFLSFKPRSQP